MRNRSLILAFFLALSSFTFAQYNNPYRITKDGNNYFVTNKGNGTVVKIDSAFNTSTIISNLYSPNDIFSGTVGPNSAIVIIDSNQVKLFDQTTYGSLINLNITGAVEAHDGVFDPNNSNVFYISDRAGNKIIKGTIGSAPFYPVSFSTLVSNILRPAGMIFDDNDRLLVVSDTTDADIHLINVSTGHDSILHSTTLDYLNDISQDGEGNYYVTSWGDNYLYRFDQNFNDQKKLTGYNDPSGMYANVDDDVLVLTCFNCNRIEFEAYHVFTPFDDVRTCLNDSFIVGFNPLYQGIGTYNSDNKFFVEVSDSNGSFASPTIIAQLSQDSVPESIKTILPQGVYASTGHKYRYRSSSPAEISFQTKDLILNQLPDAFINQSDTLSICTGSSIIIGQSPETHVTYNWTPGAYVNDSTASSTTYTNTKIGNYDLMLLANDTMTGCSNTSEVHIKVGPNLSISQLKDTIEMCPGDTVSVGVDGLPYFFSWSGSDSLDNSGIGNPSYFDIESNMLRVVFSDFTLTCTGSDSVYVQVNTPAQLAASGMITDTSCLGDTSFLSLNLDTDYTYSWTSGGTETSADQYNPSFLYASSGIKTIQVMYQNKSTLCEAEDIVYAEVLDLPVIFDMAYRDTVCQGTARELQRSMDTDLSYMWSSRRGMVLNADSIVPSFLVASAVFVDTIDVTATSLITGCISSDEMYLDVLPIIVDADLDNEGTDIKLTSQYLIDHLNAAEPILFLKWDVNGDDFNSTGDSIGFFPREQIIHGDSVRATMYWVLGSDTLCNFSSEYYEKVNLGSIDKLSSQLSIGPNPVSQGSWVNVQLNGRNIDEVSLYNVSGSLIPSTTDGARLKLDVAAGIYFIKVRSGEQIAYSKLIVE